VAWLFILEGDLKKKCRGTIISDVAVVQSLLQAPFHEQNELPVPVKWVGERESSAESWPPSDLFGCL
jgi:hypothetical protein